MSLNRAGMTVGMDIINKAEEYWKSKEMNYGMGYSENGADFMDIEFAVKDGFEGGYKKSPNRYAY